MVGDYVLVNVSIVKLIYKQKILIETLFTINSNNCRN